MRRPTFVLDNFDSFTWNLVELLRRLGDRPIVRRIDEGRGADWWRHDDPPGRLLISPGPKQPERAERSLRAIDRAIDRLPILGVCLGHQCLAVHFGLHVRRAPKAVHGKTATIDHDAQGVFRGLPSPLRVMRYHSLVVDDVSGAAELMETARTIGDGVPLNMGLRHRSLPVEGVQFHPDSFLTEQGIGMMENFLTW